MPTRVLLHEISIRLPLDFKDITKNSERILHEKHFDFTGKHTVRKTKRLYKGGLSVDTIQTGKEGCIVDFRFGRGTSIFFLSFIITKGMISRANSLGVFCFTRR
jgi:hypothetical protein